METIEIAANPKIGLKVQIQGDTLQRISLFRAPLLILERQLPNSFTRKNRPFEAIRAHSPQPTRVGLASSNDTCQPCCHSQMASKSSIFSGKAVLQSPLECPEHTILASLITWLKNYAQGKWSIFPLPSPTTAFTQKAAAHLQSIPPGKLITYQELAAAVGSPRAARAIGSFCSGNLFPLLIPCHRVIPSSGSLGAFTPDPRIKEELLQFEGITF